VSLEVNNVNVPHNAALQGIQSRQGQLHVGGYQLISKIPERAPSATDTGISSSNAMRGFAAAAQSAASAVGQSDPMKPIADGIAQELSQVNGDVFGAMGRINDMQNAFTFALASTAGLMADPALQAIS
jgi:hypothetical protein